MKRILIAVPIFIIVFVIAFLLLFPLDDVVKKQLDQQILANNLPVTYSTVEAGIFSTEITGITVNSFEAGTLTVTYSPLSLLTRSASAILTSPFGSADVKLKGGTAVTATATADLERIGKVAGQTVLGMATLNAVYDISTKKGTFNLTSGPVELQIPFQGTMMPLKLESVAGEGTMEDTNIFVTSFQANGPVNATANGRITLDPKNIYRSTVTMTVEASLYGASGRYTIRGNILSPQVLMN